MSIRNTTLLFGLWLLLAACDDVTTSTSDGGSTTSVTLTGGASTGGDGGAPGGSGIGGELGGTGGSTSTTTTSTEPTCTDLACDGIGCGQVLYDCDGDGKKENHLCPDTCAAPSACGGDYTQNDCGTKCQVLPEYLQACGFGVEFACDVDCGYCFKYIGGEPVYKSVGWECPVVETMGNPGPMSIRCCKDGCCS